jgi:hypothetical protein
LAFIISSEDDHLNLPALLRPAGYLALLLFFTRYGTYLLLVRTYHSYRSNRLVLMFVWRPARADSTSSADPKHLSAFHTAPRFRDITEYLFLLATPVYDSILPVPVTLPIGPKYTGR